MVLGGLFAGMAIAGQQLGWAKEPRPATKVSLDEARDSMGDYFVKDRNSQGRNIQPLDPGPGNIVMYLGKQASIGAIASSYGLTVQRRLLSDPTAYVVSSNNAAAALEQLKADKRVRSAQLDIAVKREKHQFVPNDPFYSNNNPTGYPGQWHLKNQTGTSTVDARVDGAWNRLSDNSNLVTNKGTGTVLGIVDDGLETAHPDLNPNYSAANSYDFGQADTNPNPVNADDDHGSAVAGVAAARGGNSIGVTGAAPEALIAGLRVDFGTSPASHFADATTFNSSGANTNIKVKNHSYGYTATYVDASAEATALNTSATAGTVHTFSAGNGRGSSTQDSNKNMLQASPDAITVAAIAADGRFAPYSSFGANVFVTAPSAGYYNPEYGRFEGQPAITTTDRAAANGYNPAADDFPNTDYTSQFGGTSASAPLVAGIMALVKTVSPTLNNRIAKHLLVRSSEVVDPTDMSISSDGGWKTNAAGFKFNQNYGFGLINAGKLQQFVLKTQSISALETATSGTQTTNLAIPDNNLTGLTRTYNLTTANNTRLEEVVVNINATHTFRGDLEAFLTSPSGTKSRLFIRSASDGAGNINWNFTSNAFWGELPNGTWSLQIRDTFAGDTGSLVSWKLDVRMGTVVFNDSNFVSQSVPLVMTRSTTNPVSLTFKNTGATTWTAATNYKLGSDNPVDNNIWGPTRANLAGGDSIAPGANKTFTFDVLAPSTKGVYNFRWRTLREGVGRFGDYSPNTQIRVVTNGRDAEMVSQSVPTTMTGGRYYVVQVVMRNIGNIPWTENTNFKLGVQNPQDTPRWGFRRVYINPLTTVAPGDTYTFNFTVFAPVTPGTYGFQWRMIQEGVAWFGDLTTNVNVNVVP